MTLPPTPTIFTRQAAKSILPKRKAGTHKWEVGGVMIVAGSPGYVGAPALTAMGAARSGAGIVHLVVNRGMVATLAALTPETIFLPLPEGEPGDGTRIFDAIGERAGRCNGFLVGPGLGDDDYSRDLVRVMLGLGRSAGRSFGFGSTASASIGLDQGRSLVAFDKPIVVDADGLNALSAIENWWEKIPAGLLVLTPHVGELARLTGESAEEIAQDHTAAAHRAASRFSQTVVLKGAPTVVATPAESWTAASAPTSLATAGTGDVLAGSIAAFLAQGLTPIEAANLAVFAGTAAAETLSVEFGSLGLVASDLPKAIARELAKLERE
jgi:NAD(P)H-hydrate repair Nnr-like enzyme with NAD(P)H-hydrate dehydratase domain